MSAHADGPAPPPCSSDHAVPPRAELAELSEDDVVEDGPDDPGRARRLEWVSLLGRAWRMDVRCCPRGGGPMRGIALIQDPIRRSGVRAAPGAPAICLGSGALATSPGE